MRPNRRMAGQARYQMRTEAAGHRELARYVAPGQHQDRSVPARRQRNPLGTPAEPVTVADLVDADIVLVLTPATTTAPKPSTSHKPVMPRWSAAPQCLKRQSAPGYPPTASRQPCPASNFAGVT